MKQVQSRHFGALSENELISQIPSDRMKILDELQRIKYLQEKTEVFMLNFYLYPIQFNINYYNYKRLLLLYFKIILYTLCFLKLIDYRYNLTLNLLLDD